MSYCKIQVDANCSQMIKLGEKDFIDPSSVYHDVFMK